MAYICLVSCLWAYCRVLQDTKTWNSQILKTEILRMWFAKCHTLRLCNALWQIHIAVAESPTSGLVSWLCCQCDEVINWRGG